MSALSAIGNRHIFDPPPQIKESSENDDSYSKSLDGIMQRVLQQKEKKVKAALANKLERYNPILIGGDLLSMGFTAFQGAQCLFPAMQSITGIVLTSLVCGVVAGLINIGVAYISYQEARQAFKNGDQLLGWRLRFDAFFLLLIGVVMIIVSLAAKLTILGAVGAFFTANPWLLPLLFFIITIPLIYEILQRTKSIWFHQDLASSLKIKDLQNLLQKDITNWQEIAKLYTDTPFDLTELQKDMEQGKDERALIDKLSQKMETLQADMGLEAGVEAFKLLLYILKKEKAAIISQLDLCKKKISSWNFAQHVRLTQQILYILGFILSMVALSPKVNANTWNAGQNFALVGANLIPLYMDLFWPFKRNTTLVVPKVEIEEAVAPIFQKKINLGESFFTMARKSCQFSSRCHSERNLLAFSGPQVPAW